MQQAVLSPGGSKADDSKNGCTTGSLEQRIEELGPWFHNLRLQGVQTAPNHFLGDYPQVKFQRFQSAIPANLSGRSVLDIGCNAGFYSLEMKRRGAERVVGIDSDPRYLAQARLAASVLNADIEFRQMSVWDVASLNEKFDLVIFMGVFYHLRHPLLALDLIHEHVARDLLLFQSMQRGSAEVFEPEPNYQIWQTEQFNRPDYPAMYFVERSYSHDATNWWIPNRSCVEAMLRSSGFEIEQHPEEEVYLCRWREMENDPAGPYCIYPASGKPNAA